MAKAPQTKPTKKKVARKPKAPSEDAQKAPRTKSVAKAGGAGAKKAASAKAAAAKAGGARAAGPTVRSRPTRPAPAARSTDRAMDALETRDEEPRTGGSDDADEPLDDAVEGEVVGDVDEPSGDAEPDLPEPEVLAKPAASGSSIAKYDPLQAYLAEIRRHDLLTPTEEHELAVRYREGGDVEAAARLVTANLRLVVKIAYEYRRAYRNILDLIQEGNIGLMQAVKKFDPYRGVKLSSYAAWWIRAYILRFILNNWRMVKIGTTQTQRKLFFNLSKEQSRLAAMGIEPTAERVADRLGVDQHDVEEMDKRMRATDLSLDAPVTDDGDGRGTSRLELTPSSGQRADDALAVSQFNEDLSKHLSAFGGTLEGREQYIFKKRLMTESPMTLQEIGDQFGLSRERVRQVERRLLSKLRAYLLENMGEHFVDIQQGG